MARLNDFLKSQSKDSQPSDRSLHKDDITLSKEDLAAMHKACQPPEYKIMDYLDNRFEESQESASKQIKALRKIAAAAQKQADAAASQAESAKGQVEALQKQVSEMEKQNKTLEDQLNILKAEFDENKCSAKKERFHIWANTIAIMLTTLMAIATFYCQFLKQDKPNSGQEAHYSNSQPAE